MYIQKIKYLLYLFKYNKILYLNNEHCENRKLRIQFLFFEYNF
jgi:hypothetical protein